MENFKKLRVKVKAGQFKHWDKVDSHPNCRITGFGKSWVSKGIEYQYAYLEYNKLDSVSDSKKRGRLR